LALSSATRQIRVTFSEVCLEGGLEGFLSWFLALFLAALQKAMASEMQQPRGACERKQDFGGVDGCTEYAPDISKPRHCEACQCHQSFHPLKNGLKEAAVKGNGLSAATVSSSAEGPMPAAAAANANAPNDDDNVVVLEGMVSRPVVVAEGAVAERAAASDPRRSPRLATAIAPGQLGSKRSGSGQPMSLAAKFAKVEGGSSAGQTHAAETVKGPFHAKFAKVVEQHGEDIFELYSDPKSVKNHWRIKCHPCQKDVACGPHKSLSNFDKHLATQMHAEALIAKEDRAKAEAERLANAKVENEQKQDEWLKKWASEGEFAQLLLCVKCSTVLRTCKFDIHLTMHQI
jgi:hypothetical protein